MGRCGQSISGSPTPSCERAGRPSTVDDVAISIVCTNNRPALEGCLDALPAACEGLRWRATVVDNASMDGTSQLVRERFDWVTLVRNERRHGFAHNHNLTLLPALER